MLVDSFVGFGGKGGEDKTHITSIDNTIKVDIGSGELVRSLAGIGQGFEDFVEVMDVDDIVLRREVAGFEGGGSKVDGGGDGEVSEDFLNVFAAFDGQDNLLGVLWEGESGLIDAVLVVGEGDRVYNCSC